MEKFSFEGVTTAVAKHLYESCCEAHIVTTGAPRIYCMNLWERQ